MQGLFCKKEISNSFLIITSSSFSSPQVTEVKSAPSYFGKEKSRTLPVAVRGSLAMVQPGFSYGLLTALQNWPSPAVPFPELLTHHFISKALISTHSLEFISIKVKGELHLLYSNMRLFSRSLSKKANRKNLTFTWLGAVVFTEGFVFGNVRIQVLQRVFRDVFSHNNFVVSKDVSEWQSRQPAFIVGFHRVESHFSQKSREGWVRVGDTQLPADILCGHSSCPHYVYVTGYKIMLALFSRVNSTDCHKIEDAHTGYEKFLAPSPETTVTAKFKPTENI